MDINPYQSPAVLSDSSLPPGRPPSLTQILHRTALTLPASFATLAAVLLIVCLPWELAYAYIEYFVATEDDPTLVIVMMLAAPLTTILFAEGVMIAAMRLHLRGERGGVAQAFAIGIQSFPRLFVWMLASGLVIGIGTAFCLLPGIYLNIRWMFVSASVVFEPGSQPLNQSWYLTERHLAFSAFMFLALVIPMAVLIMAPVVALDYLPADASWNWLASAGVGLFSDFVLLVVTCAFAVSFHFLREAEEAEPAAGSA